MNQKILFVVLVGLLSFLANCVGQTKEKDNAAATINSKFKVGQIWKYNHRPGEDSSTFTILKIEKYEKGDTIIHIRIDRIKLHSPNSTSDYSDFIGHLPFSEKSIATSATNLAGENNDLPDFSEGYNQWKDAWDNGKGGYWTVDVKEATAGVDSAMGSKK